MKLHELKTVNAATRKRRGRGISAGQGKTAGRGTKGQGARSGANRRPGFEGGQNPLMQRLPKLGGFRSRRPKAQIIHTDQLSRFRGGALVNLKMLKDSGLIKDSDRPVRLLGRGKLERSITIEVHGASRSAQKLLVAAKAKLKLIDTQTVHREQTK